MEQNNNEKNQLFKLAVKTMIDKAMLPIKTMIWAAVGTILPYILVGLLVFVVIFCVYLGTLEQIDEVIVESGNWGERIGNAVSLYGFKTNEELDKDEEGKFFEMLDLYKKIFKFSNRELSMLTQTLLYEGSNEERIYLSEKKESEYGKFKIFKSEGTYVDSPSFATFIKNIFTNYQRGFLSTFGGQSQYLEANKNLLVNAAALLKCRILTDNDEEKEEKCYEGFLIAEYNIVTDFFVECEENSSFSMNPLCSLGEGIKTDVEPGFLVLPNNIIGQSVGVITEIRNLKNSIIRIITQFSLGGPLLSRFNSFRANIDDTLILFILGTLADDESQHFYYDGYIVKNLKEEYKVRKNVEYDNQNLEKFGFEGLVNFYDKATIEKERKNRRQTAKTILELVDTYFELTYGNDDKRKNKVVGSFSEKNYMVNLNINGQNVSVSFDDYVIMLLLDKYGTDVFDFDSSMLEAAIIEARTHAYSNMNSTIGSTNFEVDGDFTGMYELYKKLSSEQRSKLLKALVNTTGKVIKDENGNLNGNFTLDTNDDGSSADEIIGAQGGNVDVKDKFASPFPTIGNLSQFLSSGYGDIDSAHITEHGGVDLAFGQGTNIYSASGGTVVASYNDCGVGNINSTCGPSGSIDGWGFSGYGNIVVVQSFDDKGIPFYTYYAHMLSGSVDLNIGDQVTTGQYIGQIGSSGSSTGPHLHFEVRYGSNDKSDRTNPLEFYGI